MNWEDIQIGAKLIKDYTGKKIGDMADLATQRLRLTSVEKEIADTYSEFGKKTYEYFCSEQDGSDVLSEYVSKLTVMIEQKKLIESRIAELLPKKQKKAPETKAAETKAVETKAPEIRQKEEPNAESDIK